MVFDLREPIIRIAPLSVIYVVAVFFVAIVATKKKTDCMQLQ